MFNIYDVGDDGEDKRPGKQKSDDGECSSGDLLVSVGYNAGGETYDSF